MLSTNEQAYRQAKLRDIEERVRRHGPHVAQAHPNRAKQFMPFAALKGFHQLLEEKEAEIERRSQR